MYRVTAPLVLAVTQDGRFQHVYAGGVVDWLSEEQAAYFSAEHLVELVDAPPAAPEPGGFDDSVPDAAATKAELVEWLVDNAVDEDGGEYSAGNLTRLNKHELRALIDAVVD